MDFFTIATLVIRVLNALLWTGVALTILRHDRPVVRLVRQLITTVIVFGMWVFVLGSLVQFGLPADIPMNVYTAFAIYAAIVAAGILLERGEK